MEVNIFNVGKKGPTLAFIYPKVILRYTNVYGCTVSICIYKETVRNIIKELNNQGLCQYPWYLVHGRVYLYLHSSQCDFMQIEPL